MWLSATLTCTRLTEAKFGCRRRSSSAAGCPASRDLTGWVQRQRASCERSQLKLHSGRGCTIGISINASPNTRNSNAKADLRHPRSGRCPRIASLENLEVLKSVSSALIIEHRGERRERTGCGRVRPIAASAFSRHEIPQWVMAIGYCEMFAVLPGLNTRTSGRRQQLGRTDFKVQASCSDYRPCPSAAANKQVVNTASHHLHDARVTRRRGVHCFLQTPDLTVCIPALSPRV